MYGELDVQSMTVAYLDLRAEASQTASSKLEQFVVEASSRATAPPENFRAIVITTRQPSDALGLELARRGVQLIVGGATESLSELFARFCEQLRMLRTASWASGAPAAMFEIPATSASNAGDAPKSPYSQPPPWFNQAAFDERLRLLQQPWRDEDAWESES